MNIQHRQLQQILDIDYLITLYDEYTMDSAAMKEALANLADDMLSHPQEAHTSFTKERISEHIRRHWANVLEGLMTMKELRRLRKGLV